MKDKKYRNIETGDIISAYDYGRESYLEQWKESKKNGEIPEDSNDFKHPDASDEELLEFGISLLSENENYEETNE